MNVKLQTWYAETKLQVVSSLDTARLKAMLALNEAGDFDWDAYNELAGAFVEPQFLDEYKEEFKLPNLEWKDDLDALIRSEEHKSMKQVFIDLNIYHQLDKVRKEFIDLIDNIGY